RRVGLLAPACALDHGPAAALPGRGVGPPSCSRGGPRFAPPSPPVWPAAAPAFALHLTPGSADGVPRTLPSVQGFDLLRGALGAGALSPTQIVIDSGRRGAVATPV